MTLLQYAHVSDHSTPVEDTSAAAFGKPVRLCHLRLRPRGDFPLCRELQERLAQLMQPIRIIIFWQLNDLRQLRQLVRVELDRCLCGLVSVLH